MKNKKKVSAKTAREFLQIRKFLQHTRKYDDLQFLIFLKDLDFLEIQKPKKEIIIKQLRVTCNNFVLINSCNDYTNKLNNRATNDLLISLRAQLFKLI